MEVAILDCSVDNKAYDNFSRVLSDTELYDVHEQEFPEDPDAVLVTGSRHGVYEDKEWIDELLEKIREYHEDGVPILGVCFGHQAVAKALGGEVENMGGYEIGYEPVDIDEGTLFEGLEDEEQPFSTHQDEVVDLPEEFEKTAESDISIHGYEHESEPVFGVQFHPEFSAEFIRELIRKKDFSDEREQRLLEQVNEENQERAERTHRVFHNFVEVVEQTLQEQTH